MLRQSALATVCGWIGRTKIKVENIKKIIKLTQAAKIFITLGSGCFLLGLTGCHKNKTAQQPPPQPPPEVSVPLVQEKQPQAAEISLEGIIYDQRKPLAIINGQLLSLQDEIAGVRIAEISPFAVTLQDLKTNKRVVKELPKTAVTAQQTERSQDSSNKSSVFVQAKQTETPQAMIYLPSKIASGRKYPLLIILPADGNAGAALDYFKEICEKHKWIMLVSKNFRTGIDMQPVIAELAASLAGLSLDYSIDSKRIVVSGFSAGAMGAHFFSWAHPNAVSAIIVNTGVIHQSLRDPKRPYPKQKYAVFLASPTDFHYQQMQKDMRFLEQLGWQVKWIEFNGGHAVAPQSAYEEAINWLKIKLY